MSDEEQKASGLCVVLKTYHPQVEMKIVEKFQQSDIYFENNLPALIILLFTASANSHYTWLKKIRQAKKLKEIPVIVYNDLPNKTELRELLKELPQ